MPDDTDEAGEIPGHVVQALLRERDEARAELAQAKAAIDAVVPESAGWGLHARIDGIAFQLDEARAMARRLAHSIIEYDGPPSPAQADALIAWDALPWAKDEA